MPREYRTFNYSGQQKGGSTFLTGIRAIYDSKEVYISAVYHDPRATTHGLIYKGLPNGKKGKWYEFNYPSSRGCTVTGTAFYGPDNGDKKGTVRVVGNYNTKEAGKVPIGCMYEGPLDGSGVWTTIVPDSKHNIGTIIHSTNADLVVGNYDASDDHKSLAKAFIYDRKTCKYCDFRIPGSNSTTIYGVIYTGCDTYNICGGYFDKNEYGYVAYLVKTKEGIQLTKFAKYTYGNSSTTQVTHFDGISGLYKGGWGLTGDYVDVDGVARAFFARIKDVGSEAEWQTVRYPQSKVTSGNSVLDTLVIGVYTDDEGEINGYLAD